MVIDHKDAERDHYGLEVQKTQEEQLRREVKEAITHWIQYLLLTWIVKNTGSVCSRPSRRKPRLVLSEAVKANRSICDGPPSCLYDTSNSCMCLCVKFEPVVSVVPANSRLPYCGGCTRIKVRALDGVSGSDRARESRPRIMEEPWGTARPLLEDRDGRTRSTISTAISKLPFWLLLPLLTTNLPKHTRDWVLGCLNQSSHRKKKTGTRNIMSHFTNIW